MKALFFFFFFFIGKSISKMQVQQQKAILDSVSCDTMHFNMPVV